MPASFEEPLVPELAPAPSPNDLLTSEQCAPLFHLSVERFREEVRRPTSVPKPLPKPIKVGRRLLWRRSDIDAWISEVFAEQS